MLDVVEEGYFDSGLRGWKGMILMGEGIFNHENHELHEKFECLRKKSFTRRCEERGGKAGKGILRYCASLESA